MGTGQETNGRPPGVFHPLGGPNFANGSVSSGGMLTLQNKNFSG